MKKMITTRHTKIAKHALAGILVLALGAWLWIGFVSARSTTAYAQYSKLIRFETNGGWASFTITAGPEIYKQLVVALNVSPPYPRDPHGGIDSGAWITAWAPYPGETAGTWALPRTLLQQMVPSYKTRYFIFKPFGRDKPPKMGRSNIEIPHPGLKGKFTYRPYYGVVSPQTNQILFFRPLGQRFTLEFK